MKVIESLRVETLILLLLFANGLLIKAYPEGENEVDEVMAKTVGELITPTTKTIRASFNNAGNLSVSYYTPVRFDRRLIFVENELVLEELELTADQTKKFTETVDSWRAEFDQINKKIASLYNKGFDKNRFDELYREVQDLTKNSEIKLHKILLPHQIKWLRQIQMRYLVRTVGLKAFVGSKSVGEYLGKSPRRGQTLSAGGRRLKGELVKMSEQALSKAVEKLTSSLNEEQREEFLRKWPYLKERTSSAGTTQLRVHFAMVNCFEQLDNFQSPFEKLLRFPKFEVNVAGDFRPVQSRLKRPEEEVLRLKMSFIGEVVSSENELSSSLSPEECKAIDEVLAEMKGVVSKVGQRSLGWDGDPKDLPAFRAELRSLRDNAVEVACQKTEMVLSESQEEILEQLAEKLVLKKSGPIVDLLEGELGEDLGLTEQNKTELRKSVEEASKILTEESIMIEETYLSSQLEALDEVEREKLKKLIGPKLKYSPANLSILINRL